MSIGSALRLATLSCLLISACSRSKRSGTETWASGRESFEARYEVKHHVELEEITRSIRTGSLDAILADFSAGSQLETVIIVNVSRPRSNGRRPIEPKFITTLSGPSGEIDKEWEAASGNRAGPFRALIGVPVAAEPVRTRLKK
jgi:hypothetical protein